uniref:Hexokinase N-terminal domain-containing protein n=1 Tax=Meloidogyne javanica TaxID=6303 RepID=A0A915LUG5_MELJA
MNNFSAYGYTRRDIVNLFIDACCEEDIQVGIVSLINDTVGTLLATSMENHDCSVGVVLATVGAFGDTGKSLTFRLMGILIRLVKKAYPHPLLKA